MANPVLHIKDSYYFEVPKVLAPSSFKSRTEFPDVWVRLDPDFQDWEFSRLYDRLDTAGVALPPKDQAREDWHHWVHVDHANFAKPFDVFLESKFEAHRAAFKAKQKQQIVAAKSGVAKDKAALEAAQKLTLQDYLKTPAVAQDEYLSFSEHMADPAFAERWAAIKREAGSIAAYKSDTHVDEWSQAKLDAYNKHLSGKILIPQPFAELRNLYEKESGGFAVSKFMVIELAVALILILVFSWLGRKIVSGQAPRGKLWNLLETFCVFIRDEVAEPAIGHHDASRFTPLLWTIFFFVLGLNLFGMVPWAGAPTGSLAVTFAMAMVTLTVVVISSMLRFGFIGFFKNLVPHMDLPLVLGIPIKSMLFLIELLGLLIKHGVLAVRLLANMVAGHLVLLGILGVAFTIEAAAAYSTGQWTVAAVVAVLAATAFSLLELFVAFLQAYIFTFLTALFIGASIHEH